MGSCDYKVGCHECKRQMELLRWQINQFLQEPAKELGRMRQEAIAMKDFMDAIWASEMEK